MKKATNNTLLGSVEIRTLEDSEKRFTEEVIKSIIFTPVNWKEGKSLLHSVGSYATKAELKSALNASRDFLLGKWVVNGKFHVYAQSSDVMRTSTIGLIQSNHSEIVNAVKDQKRWVMLNVPGNGLITFELPVQKTDSGYVVGVESPWLAMRLTGVGAGKLINTDTNREFPANTLHYHNVIGSLALGDRIAIMARMTVNQATGEIYREIHDLAIQIHTMLSDDELDPARALEEQKEASREYREVKSAKFFGTVVETVAKAKGEDITQVGTIVNINGNEMDALEVPNGIYLFADENGKAYGKPYSVASNRDRIGLRKRGELVHLVNAN